MQEPSVKERIRRERVAMGIDDAGVDPSVEGVGGKGERIKAKADAEVALRRSPEDLARMDYEKIVRDKAGRLLGTEPSRWRLLHVLYMRRLKEQNENLAVLYGDSVVDGDGGDSVTDGGAVAGFDAMDKSAVAEEVRKIDEALDAEEKMPDDDDEDDGDIVDAEKEDGGQSKKDKKKTLASSSSSRNSKGGGKAEKGDGQNNTGKWSEKRASQSKGRLEVHPDLLDAARRGEQPRSML